ncbi:MULTISPECIES: hypothetical protein [Streptomyces]|uniref:hypothetical protein n=1 Tax=Streptomyces TaxID=1883 RepID=UPI001180B271|nr:MULTISPECIES: hypothetical protein [Streptomyces]
MNTLAVRALLAALLTGTALSGCSLLPPFETCGGETDAAVAELDRLPALELHPEGAAAVDGHPWSGAHCIDDTAGAWLTAERFYAYAGTRKEVLDYYRREASAAGWRPIDDLDKGYDAGFAVFCFEAADRPSMTLDFASPEMLRELHGTQPHPAELLGVDSRTWYTWSAEAEPDGSRMDCF